MEDEELPSACPVCGREVIGSFATHLQLHSKQDLIFAIISQGTVGSLEPLKLTSSTVDCSDVEDGPRIVNQERSRSSMSPKRTHQKPAILRKTKTPNNLSSKELRREIEEVDVIGNDDSLMLQLSIGENGAIEPETTEIMPTQLCSFISDPGAEDKPNEQNPQLQTLYSVAHQELQEEELQNSHSNLIQYIIEGPGSHDESNEQDDHWILPGGKAIPVYSSFGQTSQSVPEDPLSLDAENSTFASRRVLRSSHSHQIDVDLMTDEEIPPTGEISEYEESNNSSLPCDELNKPGVMSIGSTLGSLFSNVRRISSSPSLQEQERHKPKPNLTPTSTLKITAVKSCANVSAQHKCPDPNCSQVGSIFELAQHQERVHERKYRQLKAKETSSQSSRIVGTEQPAVAVQNKKPSINEFKCSYCEFDSDKLKILHGHIAETHPGEPLLPAEYECKTCGKVFHKRLSLRKHLLIHGKKHFCHCGKSFTSGFKLMEHNRVHTKDYPFQCKDCQRNFRTPSILKTHMLQSHPKEGEVKPTFHKKVELFCNICSRVLRSKRSFNKHVALHNEKAQKCPICYEVFPRTGVLTRHIRVAHDSGYKTKESKDCPICFKKMHPNSMKSHLRIHNEEKPYSCPVCNKCFRTSANLTSHSWSHTNAEKPYKCSLCPKSYLFKKCLDAHVVVHKKGRFNFVCNHCGMKFTSKVNLKRHCDEHFSEKKYKCKLCSKKFHRKYYLVEHERIHSGTKPYTCTICGKASTTRSNHRAHLRIHDARESGTQEN